MAVKFVNFRGSFTETRCKMNKLHTEKDRTSRRIRRRQRSRTDF